MEVSRKMTISELRKALEEIRTHAEEGDLEEVIQATDHAIHELDSSRLLTTREAADMLGIRSVNTLKLLVLQKGIPYQMNGNRMMIPLAELERIQDSTEVRGIRDTDRIHDSIGDLGPIVGLTPEQLDDLAAAQPGRLPWKSQDDRAEQ
jgi:hypothetical protein